MKGNVIREIAVKNLKSSKKSNIVLGIAIALVAAFLTTILAFSYNMNLVYKEDTANKGGGAYNALVFGKDSSDLGDLKKHALIDQVGEHIRNFSKITIGENTVESAYADNIALKLTRQDILEGRNALEENEIVLDKELVEKNNFELGDIIKTNEGENYLLVGICNDMVESIEGRYNGLVSRDRALASKGDNISEEYKTTLFLTIKSKWNVEEKLKSIADDFSYTLDKNYIINEEMNGVSKEAILSFVALALLIIVSAFFIIFNLVSINFVDRVKNYGLLVTIGTNKKQLKKLMWWEIFILSIIAIPFGILFGMVIGKVIIPLVPLSIKLDVTYKLWFIPIVVIITLVTVFASIIGPVIKSTKLSPIEAVRFTSNNIRKRVKVKESKNVFNDLAKVNIWRNKRSTLTIIISLTLSGMMFIIISTLLNSMNVKNLVRSYMISRDIKISIEGSMSDENGITQDLINKIKEIDAVVNIYANKKATSVVGSEYVDIVSMNKDDIKGLEENLLDGTLDMESYIGNDKIILSAWEGLEKSSYKVGDRVEININGIEKEFEIGAIVGDYNLKVDSKMMHTFIVYEDNSIFNNLDSYIVAELDVKSGKEKYVKNEIRTLLGDKKNIQVNTFDDFLEKQSREKQSMTLIGYLIVGVIGLIGILNYTITIITSVLSRKKEFGLIRALGVKEKELRKMVMKEGVFLSSIIGLLTIAIGNVIAYILYTAFKTEATYAIYSFPLIQNIILIFVLIVVPLVIYRIAIKKVIKVPVVEQIKYSE